MSKRPEPLDGIFPLDGSRPDLAGPSPLPLRQDDPQFQMIVRTIDQVYQGKEKLLGCPTQHLTEATFQRCLFVFLHHKEPGVGLVGYNYITRHIWLTNGGVLRVVNSQQPDFLDADGTPRWKTDRHPR